MFRVRCKNKRLCKIKCLVAMAPIVCGGSVFSYCFVMQYFVSFPALYHLNDEEKVGCFTLIVFLISCDYKCYVFPQGVVCIVCDFGIFWSYSLTFLTVHK